MEDIPFDGQQTQRKNTQKWQMEKNIEITNDAKNETKTNETIG